MYPISYFEAKERFNLLEDTSATGAFQRRQFICIQVQNSCILQSPPGSMMNVSRIKSLDHYHHFGGSGKEGKLILLELKQLCGDYDVLVNLSQMNKEN